MIFYLFNYFQDCYILYMADIVMYKDWHHIEMTNFAYSFLFLRFQGNPQGIANTKKYF